MPLKWGLRLAIEGDLRYLSHRDCARLVERAAARARLPLKYTQGFNPHPVLALICPRPVGVASRDDLVVLSLTEPVEPEDLLARMGRQTPPGMRFCRAEPLAGKKAPQVRRVHCELPVRPDRREALAPRADEFRAAAAWPLERHRPGREARPVRLDLKQLVEHLELDAGRLQWTLIPAGNVWARPAEVLEALGLDGQLDLAAVERTRIEYDFGSPAPPPQGPAAVTRTIS